MLDDIRSYLSDRFTHHTALRYAKSYCKIQYHSSRHPQNPVTQNVDFHSQRELRELYQCIFYRYTALTSSVVLIGIPLYFIRRRYVHGISGSRYRSINRNTPMQKTGTLLLCAAVALYGILGRFPSDACYEDYMTYCDSDVARRARMIYNTTLDGFREKYGHTHSGELLDRHNHHNYIKTSYKELDTDVVLFDGHGEDDRTK